MCGFVIKILKMKKEEKKNREKEREQLWPLQNTRQQISFLIGLL